MLLGIVDAVLAVLEEQVQVSSPLAVKRTRNLKDNVLIVAIMATERVLFFNVGILLACRVRRVQTLFWLLQLH